MNYDSSICIFDYHYTIKNYPRENYIRNIQGENTVMGPKGRTKLRKEYEKMLKELKETDEDEKNKSMFLKAAGSWKDFDAENFKKEILESRNKSSRKKVDL